MGTAMLAKVNQPASWEACLAYLVAELSAPMYVTDWGSLLLPMLSKGPNEASTPRNAAHPASMMIQDTQRRKAVRFACGLVLDRLAWPFLGNQLTGIWSRFCCCPAELLLPNLARLLGMVRRGRRICGLR